jgi:HlyD family secretion protein
MDAPLEKRPVTARRPGVRAALGVGLAVGLALLGWALLGRGGGAAQAGYLTETVERGPIAAVVTATGVVEPVTTVEVGTYVSGPIRAIYVDFNSPVERGQVVAKIDPAPFEVKVRQAEANLATARARVEKARADLALKRLALERARQLRERDFASQGTLDAAVSDEAQARAELTLEQAGVAQAEAALQEARINLGYTDIRSPVDGVVISRSVDVGQTVAASFQTPTLFQIAEDLSKMRVLASVSESDIGGVAVGQAASFGVDAWPGRLFEGRVVQVRSAPTNVQNVVTYDVVVEVDNADLALRPGMTASVTITTARRDDALRVPLRALRFRPVDESPGEGPEVFAVEPGGGLRRAALQLGIRNDRFAEVLGGSLAPGDAVAVAYRQSPDLEAEEKRSPFQPRRLR